MDWLKTIAPTIATALGGPLGGLAYEAVSKVIGVSQDDAKSLLESGKLSSEQITSIKQAELDLKKMEEQLGLNFADLANKDRASAREMQSATHSWIPPILAILVTFGFFGILVGLMTEQFKTSEALMIMLGSLGTAWTGVIAFYFGSSAGSQAKDQMLHNSTPSGTK